jgi:hypothetical protein
MAEPGSRTPPVLALSLVADTLVLDVEGLGGVSQSRD